MAERQICTFYLNNTLFGINILIIREINRHLVMAPVHKVPEYVRGLLNLRGQIVTIIDLGFRLGLGLREISDDNRSIILKTRSELLKSESAEVAEVDYLIDDVVGLLVDRIGEVVSVDDSIIEPPPANIGEIEGHFLSGVVKLDGELLSLIKVSEILELKDK